MGKQDQNYSLIKIGVGILSVGLLAVLISTSKITGIENEQNIYGLGDVASISCEEGAFLDDFFGTNTTDANCADSPEYSARQAQSDKLPMYEKVRLAGFIGVGAGVLLVLSSFLLKRRTLDKAIELNKTRPSTSERLGELDALKQNGSLSETEYESQRRRILDEI